MLKLLRSRIKIRLKSAVLLIIVVSLYCFYQIWLEQIIVSYNTIKYKEDTIKLLKLDKRSKSVKNILFYTPFFSKKDYAFGFGNKPFVQNDCPVTNCFTTNNRQLLSKFLNCWIMKFAILVIWVLFQNSSYLMNVRWHQLIVQRPHFYPTKEVPFF